MYIYSDVHIVMYLYVHHDGINMSVPFSDTYVPFCPILSRWVGFQMFALVAKARQHLLNLRNPNHHFPRAIIDCLREAKSFLQIECAKEIFVRKRQYSCLKQNCGFDWNEISERIANDCSSRFAAGAERILRSKKNRLAELEVRSFQVFDFRHFKCSESECLITAGTWKPVRTDGVGRNLLVTHHFRY